MLITSKCLTASRRYYINRIAIINRQGLMYDEALQISGYRLKDNFIEHLYNSDGKDIIVTNDYCCDANSNIIYIHDSGVVKSEWPNMRIDPIIMNKYIRFTYDISHLYGVPIMMQYSRYTSGLERGWIQIIEY